MLRVDRPLRDILKNGFDTGGSRKLYRGQIPFPAKWENSPDRFGTYMCPNGDWTAFITDNERGLVQWRHRCHSERQALSWLQDFANREGYIKIHRGFLDDPAPFLERIRICLSRRYVYDDARINAAIEYLSGDRDFLFEYAYAAGMGELRVLPERYSKHVLGYWAGSLLQETELTKLGAYNFLIYLEQSPDEALEHLRKNLIRK